MDDDLQPRIAILGAGPIGLEAALYARYLGYPVEILERGHAPAANIFLRGSGRLGFFAAFASSLGVAALRAQNPEWQPPAASVILNAVEWHDIYLAPLAKSDLIAEVLQLNTQVIAVTRRDEVADASFQICCRDSQGISTIHEADIVIDVTGTDSDRQWFSEGDADTGLGFLNPLADYYVVGSKCHPHATFSFAEGLEQIRDLFAILGERDDLDIYATMPAIE